MSNKEKLKKCWTLFLWSFALAACMSQRSSKETPTVPVVETPKPTSGVIYDATKPAPPTEVKIGTPTPEVKPTATQVSIEGEGGPFTPEQMAIIESQTIQDKIAQLDKWVQWWGSTTNRPFLPEKVGYDVVFDAHNMPSGANDPKLTDKVGVLLTWQDAAGNMVRAERPVDTISGGHQQVPPSGDTIGEGFGPLILTAGENQILIFRNGQWVRTDKKSGEVLERIANTPPYAWEKAALGTDPDNLSVVTDWDRQPMTAEARAKLLTKTDEELVAVAPVIDPRGFYADKPEVTSLTPAGVTRLADGTTMVAYNTNETKTIGSKTMNLPGGYWNVGEGRFVKDLAPTIIEWLIEKFGVVTTHIYRILGNQLIDMHNLAVMAVLDEKGEWVKPEVETMYGHLRAYIDETFYSFEMVGSEIKVVGVSQSDPRFERYGLGAWSTGNVWYEKSYNEDLKRDTYKLHGQALFENPIDGTLKVLEDVKYFEFGERDRPFFYYANSDNGNKFSKYTHCRTRPVENIEQLVSLYGESVGRKMVLYLPLSFPKEGFKEWYTEEYRVSNIRQLASYYMWLRNEDAWRKFGEGVLAKDVPVVSDNFVIQSDHGVCLYMPLEDVTKYPDW